MVDYAEEEVDYEPSPSHGRTFSSFEEFLEWEIHPPPSAQSSPKLDLEDEAINFARVEYGSNKEEVVSASRNDKGDAKVLASAQEGLSGSEYSEQGLPFKS